jgi:hypothetical protein
MAFNLNDYETVEDRLARYWEEHPTGRIFTELVSHEAGQFIIKAYIFRDAADQVPWATGYAEEQTTTRGVNSTSALENGETSAIGRALANAGYAPRGKRPSREEMDKVQRMTKIAKPEDTRTATLRATLASRFETPEERKSWLEFTLGRDLGNLSDLTDEEISKVQTQLTEEVK